MENKNMRQLKLSVIFLYCILTINVLFSGSIQAQNKTTAKSANIDKITAVKLSDLYKKTVNMPLYLFLMEFSKVDQKAVEQAKQELQEKQEIELQGDLQLNPFHQRNSLTLKEKMSISELSFCRTCHLPLPHQKNSRSRTFNNMHSRYIACETCHLDKNKLNQQLLIDDEDLQYRWFDYNKRTQINLTQSLLSISDNQDVNKRPTTVKITPFYQQQAVVITRQHLYVKKLQENWKMSDQQVKAEIKVRTHQYLKAEGEGCHNCHRKNDDLQNNDLQNNVHQSNGLLDLSALGATKQQIKAYGENSIVNFFKRYKDSSGGKKITVNSPEKVGQQEKIQRIRITDLLP